MTREQLYAEEGEVSGSMSTGCEMCPHDNENPSIGKCATPGCNVHVCEEHGVKVGCDVFCNECVAEAAKECAA